MTLKPRHILVPTDFSKNTRNALPFALNIANKTGGKITLLHNIEEPYDFAPLAKENKQRTKARVETLMDNLLEEIQQQDTFKALNVSTAIRFGRTVFSILEAAEKKNADLIVMGTKGASNVKRMIFGSNTTEVILLGDIPVLAIPANSSYSDLSRLTFATNYRDGDLEALDDLSGLASLFESEINVLHVARSFDLETNIKFEGLKVVVDKQISYPNITFDLVINRDFLNGIADYQTDHDTRMIVLTRYKKSFFYALFEKNHSKETGLYTKLPLLVIPGMVNRS